jgi:hypothetical protein
MQEAGIGPANGCHLMESSDFRALPLPLCSPESDIGLFLLSTSFHPSFLSANSFLFTAISTQLREYQDYVHINIKIHFC